MTTEHPLEVALEATQSMSIEERMQIYKKIGAVNPLAYGPFVYGGQGNSTPPYTKGYLLPNFEEFYGPPKESFTFFQSIRNRDMVVSILLKEMEGFENPPDIKDPGTFYIEVQRRHALLEVIYALVRDLPLEYEPVLQRTKELNDNKPFYFLKYREISGLKADFDTNFIFDKDKYFQNAMVLYHPFSASSCYLKSYPEQNVYDALNEKIYDKENILPVLREDIAYYCAVVYTSVPQLEIRFPQYNFSETFENIYLYISNVSKTYPSGVSTLWEVHLHTSKDNYVLGRLLQSLL